jgi:hypothetical protein
MYLPAANNVGISTNSTSRLQINAAGNIGFTGGLDSAVSLRIGNNITGGTTSYGVLMPVSIQSDVTGTARAFNTYLGTQAATFTLTGLYHFYADQGAIGANSVVTNQYGFSVSNNLTGATNNYGFHGSIAAGANRYNLYMAGTAANYFAGQTTVGSTSLTLGSSSTSHQFGVVSTATTNVAMVIRGAASQTGDLLQVQDSAGTVVASIISGGTARLTAFRAGPLGSHVDGTHTASIVPQNVNTLALLVRGLTSQVANIQEWHNSGGTPVATMSAGGAFTATTKSFDIPHPTKENMRLRYGSLEGPENGVYVRGNTKNKVIELPDYWTGLVDESTITVTLTSIGKFQKVYLEKIEDNKVYIGGRVKEISYVIFGERKDTDKITVEY